MHAGASRRTHSLEHTHTRSGCAGERGSRGALSCEMILLSCGLSGIYFPINLLLLVCLMDYVCVCVCWGVEVSIKNKVTVSEPFCVAYISPWCLTCDIRGLIMSDCCNVGEIPTEKNNFGGFGCFSQSSPPPTHTRSCPWVGGWEVWVSRAGSLHRLIAVNMAESGRASPFSSRCVILCQLLNKLVSQELIWEA